MSSPSRLSFLVLLLSTACAASHAVPVEPSAGDAHVVATPHDAASEGAVPAPTDAATCDLSKLGFTRDNGCRNDGSVELCIGKGDTTTLDAAHAIAPELQCTLGSSGRVGCDREAELLCLLHLDEAACPIRHGALSEAAFTKVCDLAALPAIRRIAPTWYE